MKKSTYEIDYKVHLYDKQKNWPYCQARPKFPQYAKDYREINCQACLRYVEKVKKQIERERVDKILNKSLA